MLVLPDADRLWVDFNKLGERVLQAAGYRNRAALHNVVVGELVRRRFDAEYTDAPASLTIVYLVSP